MKYSQRVVFWIGILLAVMGWCSFCTAQAASAKPAETFPPLEQWKSAVIGGNAAALQALYSTTLRHALRRPRAKPMPRRMLFLERPEGAARETHHCPVGVATTWRTAGRIPGGSSSAKSSPPRDPVHHRRPALAKAGRAVATDCRQAV